jgi:pSer/pThr/pTyr-binding forkhead associated (FHA) protein
MSDLLHVAHENGEVTVQLLDPSMFRPVKSWTFAGREKITIGRSADQDVELVDPYVSRNHANLVYQDGRWLLISLGRNGVLVANQMVTDFPVGDEVRFRLGTQGPWLRFSAVAEREEAMSTVLIDTLPTPDFQVDARRLESEVGEIASGDYFQDLQQRARQMRRHRDEA